MAAQKGQWFPVSPSWQVAFLCAEAVEAVSFFTISNAGAVLHHARDNAALGYTVLLDENGKLLYGDFGEEGVQFKVRGILIKK